MTAVGFDPTPLLRDEVYRIAREALVNAFRHSGAATIEVEIEFAARALRVLVRDNGRGIDPEGAPRGARGALGALRHARAGGEDGNTIEGVEPGRSWHEELR